LLVGTAVIVLDQLTKFWAQRRSAAYRPQAFSKILRVEIVLGRGFVLRGPLALTVLVSAIAFLLVVWLLVEAARPVSFLAGLGAAAGGATSNLLDKLMRGAVLDFIVVLDRAACNLADLAIIGGVAVVALYLL